MKEAFSHCIIPLMGKNGTFSLGKVTDRGRSGKDNRLFLEAVLWIARTGSPWRDLPAHFGKWNTIFKRCQRHSKTALFDLVLSFNLRLNPNSFFILQTITLT